MSDCIFCKIIKGEIPCEKVYEDNDIFAFLDISPVNKGHTLVIPKEHHDDIWVMPPELLKKCIAVVQKLGTSIKKATNCEYVHVGVMGIDVLHAHIHIIPRFADDGLKSWPQGNYEEGELKSWGEKIRKESL